MEQLGLMVNNIQPVDMGRLFESQSIIGDLLVPYEAAVENMRRYEVVSDIPEGPVDLDDTIRSYVSQ